MKIWCFLCVLLRLSLPLFCQPFSGIQKTWDDYSAASPDTASRAAEKYLNEFSVLLDTGSADAAGTAESLFFLAFLRGSPPFSSLPQTAALEPLALSRVFSFFNPAAAEQPHSEQVYLSALLLALPEFIKAELERELSLEAGTLSAVFPAAAESGYAEADTDAVKKTLVRSLNRARSLSAALKKAAPNELFPQGSSYEDMSIWCNGEIGQILFEILSCPQLLYAVCASSSYPELASFVQNGFSALKDFLYTEAASASGGFSVFSAPGSVFGADPWSFAGISGALIMDVNKPGVPAKDAGFSDNAAVWDAVLQYFRLPLFPPPPPDMDSSLEEPDEAAAGTFAETERTPEIPVAPVYVPADLGFFVLAEDSFPASQMSADPSFSELVYRCNGILGQLLLLSVQEGFPLSAVLPADLAGVCAEYAADPFSVLCRTVEELKFMEEKLEEAFYAADMYIERVNRAVSGRGNI